MLEFIGATEWNTEDPTLEGDLGSEAKLLNMQVSHITIHLTLSLKCANS